MFRHAPPRQFIVIPDDGDFSGTTIDLTSDDDNANNGYDSDSTLPDHERANSIRNGPVLPPFVLLDHKTIIAGTLRLKKNDTVRLDDGDFLRIRHMIKNLQDDTVNLRGWRFRRNEFVHSMLPFNPASNEVCLLATIDDDDPRPALVQCMEEVPVARASSVCNLVMTNELLTENLATHHQASDHGISLKCRWIYISHRKNGESFQNRRENSVELRSFAPNECDKAVSNVYLSETWLGSLQGPKERYSVADAFCGAGGFSQGARDAGAKIAHAFDRCPLALATYRLNRPRTYAWLADAHDMISLITWHEHRVDILHISPPCQPYSPAHTRPGALDEQNTAALFSVQELVRRIRPRVVTLEETSGLVTHNIVWFRPLIQMLTTLGYSVRWKLCRFDQYGLCQSRKRLVIIASCPGGVLPPFPTPTHGPDTSRPYRTIADVLRPLYGESSNANLSDHDVLGAVRSAQRTPRTPYSANTQLRGCITTSGGTSYHPDGRPWTIRELAMLQGFPIYFQFCPAGLTVHRRQIGNAVPPVFAKALVETIIRCLRREDLDRQVEARL